MFLVIEIQKLSDEQIAIPPINQYEDLREAEGKFHQILAVAATSGLPRHSACILTESGACLRNESVRADGGSDD